MHCEAAKKAQHKRNDEGTAQGCDGPVTAGHSPIPHPLPCRLGILVQARRAGRCNKADACAEGMHQKMGDIERAVGWWGCRVGAVSTKVGCSRCTSPPFGDAFPMTPPFAWTPLPMMPAPRHRQHHTIVSHAVLGQPGGPLWRHRPPGQGPRHVDPRQPRARVVRVRGLCPCWPIARGRRPRQLHIGRGRAQGGQVGVRVGHGGVLRCRARAAKVEGNPDALVEGCGSGEERARACTA